MGVKRARKLLTAVHELPEGHGLTDAAVRAADPHHLVLGTRCGSRAGAAVRAETSAPTPDSHINGSRPSTVVATVITVLYSAPPFRTKRLGVWANVTIAIPRGAVTSE